MQSWAVKTRILKRKCCYFPVESLCSQEIKSWWQQKWNNTAYGFRVFTRLWLDTEGQQRDHTEGNCSGPRTVETGHIYQSSKLCHCMFFNSVTYIYACVCTCIITHKYLYTCSVTTMLKKITSKTWKICFRREVFCLYQSVQIFYHSI